MAEKLPYILAIRAVCHLVGWGGEPGGDPEVTQARGMTEVKAGTGRSIHLVTQDSDIRSAWDPMDHDGQMRARDQLVSTLKAMRVERHTRQLITPPMWKTD